ncbi:MAG: TylF/MycF family methyltransferase [Xanthomonadales bacterium]|nr:TylF/MycF family methyltransferase [Xanthomonadales bacterium]
MEDKIFGFDRAASWDYENGFYLTSDPSRLPKILAHYELYRSIVGLPGHVAEFGVYKGASLVRWCSFRDVLEASHSRKIIGFDAFGKFPDQPNAQDQDFVRSFERAGGDGIPADELEKALKLKRFVNFELVAGDICETLPEYVDNHPELKLSLVHIDVDVYEPTTVILSQLYDRVVRGGLIVMDDYGIIPGETRAVDKFFAEKGGVLIEKSSVTHTPSYIRKR